MKLLQHTIQPFQGIKECLQSLLSRGYILGIVTSKTYQEYYSDFEPLGLADYFSTIVCADDDSGLVLWSNNVSNPIRADYYFKTPNDISKIL